MLRVNGSLRETRKLSYFNDENAFTVGMRKFIARRIRNPSCEMEILGFNEIMKIHQIESFFPSARGFT